MTYRRTSEFNIIRLIGRLVLVIFYRLDMRCAYEFQRFEKVAWSHVQKGAKLVFDVRLMNQIGPVCICLLWNLFGNAKKIANAKVPYYNIM